MEKKTFAGENILLSITMLLAISVMIGWKIQSSALIQIMPTFVPMQFNTALLLGTTALGLFLLEEKPLKTNTQKIAISLFFFNIGFALLSLLQYILNTSFNVDEIFHQHTITTNTSHAGRMSPQTAICFIVTNMGALLAQFQFYNKHLIIAARVCGLSVFAYASFAFLGYLLDFKAAYTIKNNLTQMAAHTSLGFILLSISLKFKILKLSGSFINSIKTLIPVSLLLFAVLFELLTPPGISATPAYAPAIIFAMYFQRKTNIIILTIVTSILITIDFYIAYNPDDPTSLFFIKLTLTLAGVIIISALAFIIKATIDKLQDQKQFNEAIVNTTIESIITMDTKGIITSINKATEKMFGYTKEELINKNISLLMPSNIRSQHDKYLSDYAKTGKKSIIGTIRELQAIHKTKGVFDIELSVSEIFINSKKFYTGIIRDITARKKSEEEINRSHHELERFAYIVSHDLQEPLRKLMTFTELVTSQKNLPPEKSDYYFKAIYKNAQNMSRLIKDILEYSKVSHNQNQSKEVNLNVTMHQIKENLSILIDNSDAKIEYNSLPTIEINPVLILQLLQNIISNAIKYVKPDTRPHIQIRVTGHEDYWLFEVEDSGIGIAEENLDIIFHPFKRLHSNQSIQGSGIGLSICKKIVQQLHGKIWVKSVENEGTIFYWSIQKKESNKIAS